MASKKYSIIFDFDGTLIDIAPRHYRVYAAIVKKLNGRPLDQKTYWELKRGNTSWDTILTKSGGVGKNKFLDEFVSNIEKPNELKQDELFPGVFEILESLSISDYKLYLVSLRRNPDSFYFQINQLGIEGFFEETISGHSDKAGQHTKVEIVKRLDGLTGGVMVGDTEVDILTAKELALKSVAVTSGIRSKKSLEALTPDFILDSVTQLETVI